MSLTYGQTASDSNTQDDRDPRVLKDKAVTDRLHKDWTGRNSELKNELVQWYEFEDGYYGYYNNGTTPHTAFYGKDGNYIQSYRKSDWNMVSPALKTSYDVSKYKDREVSAYWESSEPEKKGSYLELIDNKGKNSRVWVDDKGQFSSTSPKVKPKSK